jgi:hypothetical protein
MNTLRKPAFFVVVGTILAASVCACSSSDSSSSGSSSSGSSGGGGGGGAGAVSSVDSSKQLGSLTQQEATQYCNDANAYASSALSADDIKKATCNVSAAFGTFGATSEEDAKAKCEDAYKQCVASSAPAETGGKECATASLDAVKGCTATVAELNQCEADQIAALKALAAKGDPCPNIQFGADAGPSSSSSTQPASCASLQEKCPNLFKSDSSSGGQ